jgi:hypothetical protein
LEVSRGSIANSEDALDDEGVEGGLEGVASSRAAVKHVIVVGSSVTEALAPFLDPGKGAMGGSSVVVEGPGGLKVEQRAEQGSVSEPTVFHGATSTEWSCDEND